ncbi:MAG TPA: N-acetylglucosamine/diacetylchitobiose ABC transporter substrate-binding protein [Beutenbergiaceae bacterium]|nr:N-acetylglucosamine/diacetylchitobiose ABC transporter substrate-binding protein [Beutenbergiaceae bacterium]
MTNTGTSVNRRSVLIAAMGLPLGVTLASCATGGGDEPADDEPAGNGEDQEVDADNPFGVQTDSAVEAVIFDGGYGIDYVENAAEIMQANFPDMTFDVSGTVNIAPELQPRFVGGDPPDLIDNAGAQQIGFTTILNQLEELDDVIDAPNLEGEIIRDTLFDGVLEPGTYDGRFVALNYVLTVYGLWYSGSLFAEHGWEPPTTWAEAMDLGAAAQDEGLYLFCWGQEAATYYQTLAIDSAIKEAGDELRLSLEHLEEGAWSHEALQDVFHAMKDIVDAGYFLPGGSGTQFTAAQAQWSLEQQAILYPSGSWIENEMADQTAEGFEMRGFPSMALSDSPALGVNAIHSTAGEPFIVPSDAENVAAGKELLRTMLSREAAEYFAREKLAPTVVAGTVPEDGFGSTALVSQTEMLEQAEGAIFTHDFVSRYGMNQEMLVVWNSFLDGQLSVEELTDDLQSITDGVREDDAIDIIEVT